MIVDGQNKARPTLSWRVRPRVWFGLLTLLVIVFLTKSSAVSERVSWAYEKASLSALAIVGEDSRGHDANAITGPDAVDLPVIDVETFSATDHAPNQDSRIGLLPVDALRDECATAPDSKAIFVSIKTGASELTTKLPSHLLTLARCVHDNQIKIYSDLDDSYGGYAVHGTIKNVSKTWSDDHPDLKTYWELAAYRDEGSDLSKLRGEQSWNLDKWKFLPLTFHTFEAAPAHVEWFVFIEADTSLSWNNLLIWLKTLDPKEQHYLGAPRVVGETEFLHGGSGYVMSRPSLTALAQKRIDEGTEEYDARWRQATEDSAFGDEILSRAMAEAGVSLEGAEPMLQAESLQTVDFHPDKLCQPVVTLHHVDATDVTDIWRLQARWVREHGWGKAYLWRHFYEHFGRGHFGATRASWTNYAESKKLIDEAAATQEERESDWFVPRRDMNRLERLAPTSPSRCAAACERREECFQWQWKPSRCYLGDELRVGGRDTTDVDDKWMSGWMQERVARFEGEMVDCVWPPAESSSV